MSKYIKPVIVEEVPAQCDTCGYEGAKEPITQVKDAKGFGKITRVIGYWCPSCETGHLYQ